LDAKLSVFEEKLAAVGWASIEFRDLLDSILSPLAIVDRELRLVGVNEAYSQGGVELENS
jgi:hypothetical protein